VQTSEEKGKLLKEFEDSEDYAVIVNEKIIVIW
jgi:hypothetical protein